MFMYGNYIDEPIMTYSGGIYFYVQDHLYSTAALVDASGTPQERYEYDAYGQVHVLDANFADDADGVSDCGNPYMFTGRRVDFVDGVQSAYYFDCVGPKGKFYGVVPAIKDEYLLSREETIELCKSREAKKRAE